MSERDLRAVVRDLERRVPLPDFEVVAARGRRLRRRRRTLKVAAATAALTAAVAVGAALARAPLPEEGSPASRGAARPVGVADVLRDPASVVDDPATVVNDTGAVLHRVTSAPGSGPCAQGGRTVWVWTPWDGRRRAWVDTAGGRTAVAVPGGFAVSAPDAGCDVPAAEDTAAAYVVDAAGRRTAITWTGRSRSVCPANPGAARCEVDVRAATGRLRDRPVRLQPSGTTTPVPASGRLLWAASLDARTLHWSADGGTTWRSRRSSLAEGNVQVAAAGGWAVFFSYPEAEYTRDGGRTWRTWDGRAALAPVVLANELVTVSADGDLVVVTHRPGRRPQLLASTDDTWQELRATGVRTAYGTVAPRPAGPFLWVPDQGRTWVTSDGVDWRVVDPLRR